MAASDSRAICRFVVGMRLIRRVLGDFPAPANWFLRMAAPMTSWEWILILSSPISHHGRVCVEATCNFASVSGTVSERGSACNTP